MGAHTIELRAAESAEDTHRCTVVRTTLRTAVHLEKTCNMFYGTVLPYLQLQSTKTLPCAFPFAIVDVHKKCFVGAGCTGCRGEFLVPVCNAVGSTWYCPCNYLSNYAVGAVRSVKVAGRSCSISLLNLFSKTFLVTTRQTVGCTR